MRNIVKALKTKGLPRRIGGTALFLFLLGLTMSAFAIVTALQLRMEMASAFRDLHDTREMQARASSVLAGLVDAETAYRGYLLVGDQAMLAPYLNSLKQTPQDLSQLRQLATPENEIQPYVERLANAATTTLEAIVGQVKTASALQSVPPADIAAILDIKLRLDAVRQIDGEIHQKLNRQIVARQVAIEKIAVTLLVTIATLILGVLLVSFTQVRELAGQTVRYFAAEQQSREQIDDLSGIVTRSKEELADLHIRLRLALREARVQVFTMVPDQGITSITDDGLGLTEGFSLPVGLAAIADPEHSAEIVRQLTADATPAERDFEIRRARPDGSVAWFKVSLTPSESDPAAGFLGTAVNITELKNREEGNFWLMRELSHRSQNLLAIVQAIARQTAKTVSSTGDFESRFSARLRALATTHDLLVKSSYSGAGLGELLTSQLGQLAPLVGTRIILEGPEILLRPEAAQNIALALHELAANAAIHGALSVPEGKIQVSWAIEGSGVEEVLILQWQESGGPAPSPRIIDGFGTTLIAKNLPRSLEGEVILDHPPAGTYCRMSLPMRRLRAEYSLTPTPVPR